MVAGFESTDGDERAEIVGIPEWKDKRVSKRIRFVNNLASFICLTYRTLETLIYLKSSIISGICVCACEADADLENYEVMYSEEEPENHTTTPKLRQFTGAKIAENHEETNGYLKFCKFWGSQYADMEDYVFAYSDEEPDETGLIQNKYNSKGTYCRLLDHERSKTPRTKSKAKKKKFSYLFTFLMDPFDYISSIIELRKGLG
ncbi:hypothetical protein K7X08_014924 [Anisodus acutangulus]|uniref:Uncharacterized protein n=1 Tax=Anisodus acutangulus TaxID=402998 RepID=A0A9Q1LKM7_9SOLA|nr:hypothetical protein K7X08_014924 [Anisodus acutangulus]